MEIKPKIRGAPMINCICSECGEYFSEQSGHTCDDDAGYY